MNTFSAFLVSFVCGYPAFAVEKPFSENVSYVMCRQDRSVRTLRVFSPAAGACVTTYTKEGLDQEIARSTRMDLCSEVMGKVKENLEKANWKCRDLSGRSSVSGERNE